MLYFVNVRKDEVGGAWFEAGLGCLALVFSCEAGFVGKTWMF